jgi:hypothetical protein
VDLNSIFGGTYKIVLILLPIFFSAVTGYILGAAKTFREQKLKVYEEILPPIVKVAFDPGKSDQPDFNKALLKLWLFASRKVALKMDHAISILVKPERGDAANALQDAIAEMRTDIQFLRWQRVKSEEVKHFYTQIRGKEEGSNKANTTNAKNRTAD